MSGSLRQGEIISDLVQIVIDLDEFSSYNESNSVIEITHPYAIIVTQDCDLEQDFKVRSGESLSSHRLINSILFCIADSADERILKPPLIQASKKSMLMSNITKNKDERFHYLERVPTENDKMKKGLPDLIVEFKHYFTIPTEEVYKRLDLKILKRRCQLKSPYLEHFNLRYHYYHNRIALPGDHSSE